MGNTLFQIVVDATNAINYIQFSPTTMDNQMKTDATITLHHNQTDDFSCEVWSSNVDGEDTVRIIPVDESDGFNADWNPTTHVFRVWYENSIDHVSEHRAGSITDAVELLRRYLNS